MPQAPYLCFFFAFFDTFSILSPYFLHTFSILSAYYEKIL